MVAAHSCEVCLEKFITVSALSDHQSLHLKAYKEELKAKSLAPAYSAGSQPSTGQPGVSEAERALDEQLRMQSKLATIRMMQDQGKPQAAPSPIDRLQEMATMMRSFKEMFPQRDSLEVLKEIQAFDSIRDSLSEGAEPESMDQMAMKAVVDLIKQKAISTPNKEQQQQPGVSVPIPSTSPAPVAVPVQAAVIMEEVLTDEQIKDYINQLPPAAIAAVKSGQISLEDAKAAIREHTEKQGIEGVTGKQIEQVYNTIKDEAK